MNSFAVAYRRDRRSVDLSLLQRMLTPLAHRPLGEGDMGYASPVAWGAQARWPERNEAPTVSSKAGVWVVGFNGRLDNRAELRRRLSGIGPQSPDVDYILTAYLCWEIDCFSELLGPFAVVIYDERSEQLIAARDPVGSRPLYYHITSDYAFLATEEQALLPLPVVSKALDQTSLLHYFALRFAHGERTMFRDVRQLQPGQTLQITTDAIDKNTLWQFEPQMLRGYSDDEYAAQFRELLQSCIRARLGERGVTGFLMSGGSIQLQWRRRWHR